MSLHIEDMDKNNLGEVKKTVSVSTEELRRLHEIDAIEAEQKIVEKVKDDIGECYDKQFNMATEPYYIEWVSRTAKKYGTVSSDNIPENIPEEDKKNIGDLFIFYGLVHSYAYQHDLDNIYPSEGVKSHTVKLKDSSFTISESRGLVYTLSLNSDKDAQFRYEDLMSETISRELFKTNDDPDFVKRVSEAFADFDEEVKKDIENSMKGNEDKISEIARLLLDADKGEERDRVLFENFKDLKKEYDRIVNSDAFSEEYAQDEIFNMRLKPDYINWLSNYVGEKKILENGQRFKGNDTDKENIGKLNLFYDIIESYMNERGKKRKEHKYAVAYNGTYFLIAKSENGSTYAVDITPSLVDVDYEDILAETAKGVLKGPKRGIKLIFENKPQESENNE